MALPRLAVLPILSVVGCDHGASAVPRPDVWLPIATVRLPCGPAVWTGSEMIATSVGWVCGRYDPLADAWTPTARAAGLPGEVHYTAVWTGSEMILWGGADDEGDVTSGAGERYHPATDTWRPTASAGAPVGRAGHTALWTGTEMIVWGGYSRQDGPPTVHPDGGGRYDPTTDRWRPTSTVDAPSVRSGATAVWTGTEMVVWGGGVGGAAVATGGRYDPETDTWRPTSTAGAPVARSGHTAVWTGTEMIVWGGRSGWDEPELATGGRYDPATDTWAPMAATEAPAARDGHTAVWTGAEMIVWGGFAQRESYERLSSGGRYDPRTDQWNPMSSDGSPANVDRPSSMWTGTEMFVWACRGGGGIGARYRP